MIKCGLDHSRQYFDTVIITFRLVHLHGAVADEAEYRAFRKTPIFAATA